MFPTIHDCQQLPEAEKSELEELDYRLRRAALIARGDGASSRLEEAVVTVLLSVAADAAMLASGEGERPPLEAFLDAAEQAFHWAQRKRSQLRPS